MCMRQSEAVQLASSSARPCARLKINFEKYIVLAARTAWLCLYACRPTAKTYAVAEQGLSCSPPLGDVSNHRDYMCLIDHRQETGGADAKMTCIWLPCPAPLSLRRGYDPLVDGHAVPIHLPLLPSIMLVSISYHRRLFGRCDACFNNNVGGLRATYVWCDLRYACTSLPRQNPMPFSIETASPPPRLSLQSTSHINRVIHM